MPKRSRAEHLQRLVRDLGLGAAAVVEHIDARGEDVVLEAEHRGQHEGLREERAGDDERRDGCGGGRLLGL